jgi:hypothetical protein
MAAYSALDSWRTATSQERVGATPTGLTTDPSLTNPGHGGTIGDPELLANLTAYTLLAASPVDNAGLNLRAVFGIDPGSHDFYGVALTPDAASIGASE